MAQAPVFFHKKLRPGSQFFRSAVAALLSAALVFTPAQLAWPDTLISNGQYWTVEAGGSHSGAWNTIIGQGRNTPANNPAILTINPGATVNVVNQSAISLGDNATIYVNGTVIGNSSGGGGLYGAGPNVIEGNSNLSIYVGIASDGTINSDALVTQTGSTTNGEAINLMGFSNQITNYGQITSSRSSAAVWFQDVVSSGGDPTKRNIVTNYGTISRTGGGNVMGTSAGNGIIFYNKSTGVVEGNLSFSQGNDDLYFEAGSKVTGSINGGGGTNSLYLEGDGPNIGQLQGAVTNFQTLTKVDKGTWEITGQLQGFKTTTVDDGILRVTGNNANYTGTLLINRNDALGQLGVVEARAQSLPTGGVYDNGILRFINDDTGTYTGLISGTGSVEMTGTGTVVLAPSAAGGNTYTGGTYVKNGALGISADNALGAVSGPLVLGDGTTIGTLQFQGNFNLDAGRSIELRGPGGAIDTNGFTTTISQAFDTPSSNLYKKGSGTLVLTGDSALLGAAIVQGGTLQIGNGGTAGSLGIGANSYAQVDSGAALAFDRSNQITVNTRITGGGKLIQRGAGALALNNANSYTGGTEIESGRILILNEKSLGATNGAGNAGHVMYTGGAAAKTIVVMPGVSTINNHFHADTGTENVFQTTGDTEISGVNINRPADDAGGAFYVGANTALTLDLFGDLTLKENKANGVDNDIYVASGGTMNIAAFPEKTVYVQSGIAGAGTLNATGRGTIQVEADSAFTGATNVNYGTFRVGSGVTYGGSATAGAFNVNNTSSAYGTVAGGGLIRANNLNVGGVVSPDNITGTGSKYGTLTFQASGSRTFSGFVLDYDTAGPTEIDGNPTNNSQDLLVINGGTVGSASNGFTGTVNFRTEAGTSLARGEYQVIVSDTGFNLGSKQRLNGIGDSSGALFATVNGTELTNNGNTPRGTIAFDYRNSGKEIWLVAETNSLTMDWTGISGEQTADWIGYQERFLSLQENPGVRETMFMDGDKVHISNPSGTPITVRLADSQRGNALVPTVSGLVVGKNSGTDGTDGTVTNGNIVISGSGGITANKDSAFGVYTQPATGTSPQIVTTGKLEKYGAGTLHFSNTGGNTFESGIDLHGGLINFGRADQLGVGSGAAIRFVGDATLMPAVSLDFGTEMVIEYGVTASLAVYDDINGDPNGLFLEGNLNGPGNLRKEGAGILQFAGNAGATNAIGDTTVVAGKFRVAYDKTNNTGATYNSTGLFTLSKDAELSGGGTVVAGKFTINGKLAADKATMTADNMEVSGDDRIGTLTLRGTSSASSVAEFNSQVVGTEREDFNFDYRPTEVNLSDSDMTDQAKRIAAADNTKNDLLAIRDMNAVNLQGGVINFLTDGGSLTSGNYLIIDSNTAINNTSGNALDGINNRVPGSEGAVWGKINGKDIVSGGPRGDFEFVLQEGTVADSQLWLTVDHNTLQTVWQGGNGLWSTGAGSGWRSRQYTGVLGSEARDYNFYDGDLVYFTNATASTYTVTIDRDVIVSGLDVSPTDAAANIIFDGAGGITAKTVDSNLIVGDYANQPLRPDNLQFDTTGKLVKRGAGTLTLANTGENEFEQGVDIYAGSIALTGTEADRLGEYDGNSGDNNGLVTFKNDNGGNTDMSAKGVTVESEQTLKNRFVVEANTQGAAITANADTTISGVTHISAGDEGGALFVNDGSILAIKATGGDITLKGNENIVGGVGKANDLYLAGTGVASFDLADGHNVFIESGVASVGGTIRIQGEGRVQIASNTDNNGFRGLTNVESAGLRVIKGQTYGTTDNTGFTLGKGTNPGDDKAYLEGDGTIRSNNIRIGGYVSPDAYDLRDSQADREAGKAATLTLRGTNAGTSSLTFASVVDMTRAANDRIGFHLDYDAVSPNSTASEHAGVTDAEKQPGATSNDLLAIRDMNSVKLEGGVINFVTEGNGLKSGRYLIIDSDTTITDGNGNRFSDDPNTGTVLDGINNYTTNQGVLWGKVDGVDIRPEDPRADRTFYLDSRDGVDDSQIWLEVDNNSLKMVWQGGSGAWTTGSGWKSGQSSEIGGTEYHSYDFNNGDYVVFGDTTGAVSLVNNVIVSGLDAAITSAGNVVTIDGAGGIRGIKVNDAGGNTIEGKYAKTDGTADTARQEFNTSGKLVKTGAGELAFRNIGLNDFAEGIEISGGAIAFDLASQLGNVTDPTTQASSGNKIKFLQNSTLRADDSATTYNDITIDTGKTATLEAAADSEWKHSGNLTGAVGTTVDKTGAGTLSLYNHINDSGDSTPADFDGRFEVSGGTLAVHGDYGRSTAFEVKNGATLSGTGVIGGISNGGIIRSGGTLAPGGLTAFNAESAAAPGENPLNVAGNLTFESGSVFDVRLTQYGLDSVTGKYTPYSDRVNVTGVVTISSGAGLNVTLDYWGGTQSVYDYNQTESGYFTIISAGANGAADPAAQFLLALSDSLPRGVKLAQGWNQDGGDWDYQLWFEGDPDSSFQNLCDKPNRQEIGSTLDQLVLGKDQGMKDLISHLSAPCFSNGEVCEMLDQLTGDLYANAMWAAFKKPWRHPFNQLDARRVTAAGEEGAQPARPRWQSWAEIYGNRDRYSYDGNAHSFKLYRTGLAAGLDYAVGEKLVVGGVVNVSDARVRQDTGDSDVTDYEIGLYSLASLGEVADMKVYLGYSWQEYDLKRKVNLKGCETSAAISEKFGNDTEGNGFAASLEFSHLFNLSEKVRVTPLVALDYEKIWIDGYTETGGLTALEFKDEDMEKVVLRLGADTEFAPLDNLDLKVRLRYERQLNSQNYPEIGVRFANSSIDSGYADIRGSQVGRDNFNLSAGFEWRPKEDMPVSFYGNYDLDVSQRKTGHGGQVGLVFRW